MNKWGAVLLATIAHTGLANATDLAARKSEQLPTPAAPDCFSNLWTYLSSSVDGCPLSYAGVTLYGTLDGGYGYETHGVPGNPSADKVNYAIQKNSGNTHWLWSPNALEHIGDRPQNARKYRRTVLPRFAEASSL